MKKRSGLGIEVFDRGIATILHHNKLTVPPNQRSYAWEESHVQTLFEDISAAIANRDETYFLGTIVLTQGSGDRLEVADGQQRLATSSILIAAIRDYLLETEGGAEEKSANVFTGNYLLEYDVKSGENTAKLHLNFEDNDFFFKRILLPPDEPERKVAVPTALSHERLESAAEIARAHVEKITSQFAKNERAKKLYEWIEFLQESAMVIEIRVPEEVDAFTMFETLNDRGLKASQTDILKNYLFKNAKERVGEIQIKWAAMNATIEAVGDNDLLLTYIRHYWTLLNGYTVERTLAAQVKERVNSKQQAVNMVVELDSYAADYTGILSPLEYMGWPQMDRKMRGYIYVITRILNIEQIRPLILAVIKKFEPNQAREAFKLLLSWSVRFLIAGSGGGGPLDRGYGQAAKEVMDGVIQNLSQLRDRIKSNIPRSDSEFKEKFSKCRVSANDLARYYLRSLELKRQGVDPDPELGGILDGEHTFNLEHIMPQRPSDGWPVDNETIQQLCKRLGNITLLNPAVNVRLGNQAFSEKKLAYAASPVLLTQEVSNYAVWGMSEIEERQKKLAELALEVWKL